MEQRNISFFPLKLNSLILEAKMEVLFLQAQAHVLKRASKKVKQHKYFRRTLDLLDSSVLRDVQLEEEPLVCVHCAVRCI